MTFIKFAILVPLSLGFWLLAMFLLNNFLTDASEGDRFFLHVIFQVIAISITDMLIGDKK